MEFSPLAQDFFTFEHSYAVLRAATQPEIALLVGDADRVFSLASVTKPIVSYAVLVGVENGLFSLENPCGPDGSTLRHILAHASGLPSEPGAPIAKPGERRIYSNYGFDVLGEFISERLGMSAQEYVHKVVLAPLAMDTCTIAGSLAYSGRASLDSLLRFLQELLHPTLISREMLTIATSAQFPGIPGILPGYGRQQDNSWGLGFSLRAHKHPHWLGRTFSPQTFGHFGQSGSFIWVDPEVGKGGVFLGARKFEQTHVDIWPALTDAMREC